MAFRMRDFECDCGKQFEELVEGGEEVFCGCGEKARRILTAPLLSEKCATPGTLKDRPAKTGGVSHVSKGRPGISSRKMFDYECECGNLFESFAFYDEDVFCKCGKKAIKTISTPLLSQSTMTDGTRWAKYWRHNEEKGYDKYGQKIHPDAVSLENKED